MRAYLIFGHKYFFSFILVSNKKETKLFLIQILPKFYIMYAKNFFIFFFDYLTGDFQVFSV